jgi:hypothetical protein
MALFCDAKPLIIYLMEGELETQFETPTYPNCKAE